MDTKKYLHEHHVAFDVLPHEVAFDACHLAQAVHTPGREVAKCVLLRADGGFQYIVAVLPATHRVDLDDVSLALGGAEVELASEPEIAKFCPDCELGMVTPFGSHCGAETIVDASLAQDEEIVFGADTHSEAIRMKYGDYRDIEHPRVARFAKRIR
jgi:Ala-tRNA(Pro) deacylase